jgi:NAD(P)-dependent dehydrogenase (short-subunit alcohol dehydrogenase family)
MLSQFSLEGQVAVVTGASQGIGKAVAVALAQAGADVVVNYRSDLAGAEDTVRQIKKEGKRALIFKADVAYRDQVKAMAEKTIEEFGKVDILFNNAGINIKKTAEEMDEETWKRVLEVNLDGTYHCCEEFGKYMIERKQGKIINCSSICGGVILRNDFQIAYHSSKGGVILLTKALAEEWSKYNIRVNMIAPGYTRTNMCPTGPKDVNIIPLKRMAEPEEMAGAVIFFASDASGYITGQELFIDGGYSICGSDPNSSAE